MKKLKYHTLLMLCFLFLVGCKSNEFIHDFKIGMTEEVWKPIEMKLLNQNSNLYAWKIDDTTLSTRIALNSDGLKEGSLRIIAINLDTETAMKDSLLLDKYSYCPTSKFDRVLRYLTERLGKPDSVTFETHNRTNAVDDLGPEEYLKWRQSDPEIMVKVDSINRSNVIDTAVYNYYFHDDVSIILLRRVFLDFSVNKLMGATVYQFSKDYEKLLSDASTIHKRNLKPIDLVGVPISVKAGTDFDLNGSKEKRLYLTAVIDSPIQQFLTLAEERKVKSIKGRIVIKDDHGDSVLCYPDFKLELQQPLQRPYNPGLDVAMGNSRIFAEPFMETRRSVFVRIDHPSTPFELKAAFEKGSTITADFIPESLLFTDNTTLKN